MDRKCFLVYDSSYKENPEALTEFQAALLSRTFSTRYTYTCVHVPVCQVSLDPMQGRELLSRVMCHQHILTTYSKTLNDPTEQFHVDVKRHRE